MEIKVRIGVIEQSQVWAKKNHVRSFHAYSVVEWKWCEKLIHITLCVGI